MLDEQKWIGAQAIMKCLLDNIPYKEWQDLIPLVFKFSMGIIEDYATSSNDDELIDSGIEIPKLYWNLPTAKAKQEWLTEWGRQKKNEDTGWWYVACKKKDLGKLKQVFEERENGFQEMIKKHEEKI